MQCRDKNCNIKHFLLLLVESEKVDFLKNNDRRKTKKDNHIFQKSLISGILISSP